MSIIFDPILGRLRESDGAEINISSLDVKESVETVADIDIILSGEQTINGVTTSNSRIAVIGQTFAQNNGLYDTAAGAWTRTSDADSDEEVTNGMITIVLNSDSTFYRDNIVLVTSDPIILDTTLLQFEVIPALEFGTTAGTACEGNDSRLLTDDEREGIAASATPVTALNPVLTEADPTITDYIVDVNDTGTHTTIQSAIDAAETRDLPATIQVLAGSNYAGFTITKPNIIITGGAGGTSDIVHVVGDIVYNLTGDGHAALDGISYEGELLIEGNRAIVLFATHIDGQNSGGSSCLKVTNTNSASALVPSQSRFTINDDLAPAMEFVSGAAMALDENFAGSNEYRRNGENQSANPVIDFQSSGLCRLDKSSLLGHLKVVGTATILIDNSKITVASGDTIVNTGHSGVISLTRMVLSSFAAGGSIFTDGALAFHNIIAPTNLIINGTDVSIYITSAGGSDTELQYNDNGSLAGITGIHTNGNDLLLDDNVNFILGTNLDFLIVADGTDTVIDNFTGNLLIRNSALVGNILLLPLGGVGINTLDPKTNLHIVTDGTVSALGTGLANRGIVITGSDFRTRLYFELPNTTTNKRVFSLGHEQDSLKFMAFTNDGGAILQQNLITLQSEGPIGMGVAVANPSAQLELGRTIRGFLQTRLTETQRNAISNPKEGLSLHNTNRRRPEFFDDLDGSGSAWQNISVVSPTTVEIFTGADVDALAIAGIITIATGENLTLDIKSDVITSATRFVLEGTAELRIRSANANAVYLYSEAGSETFISGNASRVSFDNIVLVDTSAGSTLIDIIGATFNIQISAIIGWSNLGFVVNGKNFVIHQSQIESCDSGFTSADMEAIEHFNVGLVLDTMVGNYLNISNTSKTGTLVLSRVSGQVGVSNALVRIDPSVSNFASIVDGCNITEGSLFDITGGSTNIFTAIADNSITSTAITTVSDDGGSAKFNHAGTDPSVGEKVILTAFSESTYNIVGVVTAVDAGVGFTVGTIVFTGTDTGDFETKTITVTSAAHGLSNDQTLILDSDFSTDYGNEGFTIFNVQTNTFDCSDTFIATQTGLWDTSGINQKDPRVLASSNPGFIDSKYISTAFVNDNITVNGTIVNNIFTDMIFGTIGSALVAGSTMERWKLIDELNGTFEYIGNEPFDGYISFDFTFLSSGGSQDFRNKWVSDDGSGFEDLDDNVESLVNVGNDAQSITKTFPLKCNKGCKIKPQITREAGSSEIITAYATMYATQ